jgi:hypothetical protein
VSARPHSSPVASKEDVRRLESGLLKASLPLFGVFETSLARSKLFQTFMR